LLTEKRETTDKAESIKLIADRTQIDANGEDIAVVRVEVLDKEGRMIPTADNQISFKVTGEGTLIGVGNGDPNCQESDKEPKHSLFNGLAQVIVQATKVPGSIVIEAYTEEWPGPKLPSTTLTITTKKVELRSAL
jgi:beta-galactosidase